MKNIFFTMFSAELLVFLCFPGECQGGTELAATEPAEPSVEIIDGTQPVPPGRGLEGSSEKAWGFTRNLPWKIVIYHEKMGLKTENWGLKMEAWGLKMEKIGFKQENMEILDGDINEDISGCDMVSVWWVQRGYHWTEKPTIQYIWVGLKKMSFW